MASDMEPAINSEHPTVRDCILVGQSSKDDGMSSSRAIVGSATTVSPERRVEIAVINVTDVMTTAVLDFDVIVALRSRLCSEATSLSSSLDILAEARELLGRRKDALLDLRTTASGGWRVVSSICV
jgi:hypothetical protein